MTVRFMSRQINYSKPVFDPTDFEQAPLCYPVCTPLTGKTLKFTHKRI